MKAFKHKDDFIIYEGEHFVVEWYYTEDGRLIGLEYFNRMSVSDIKKLAHLVEVMADVGKIFDITKFRHEGDQVYAFKPAQHRFVCFFFEGKKIIITHAFEKKADKMPPTEKTRALKLRQDYISRVKLGKYYGKKNRINNR